MNTTQNNEWEKEIYQIIDSFLTEAKDQHGNDRSLERLNADRHLAADKFLELFLSQRQDIIKQIEEEVDGLRNSEEFRECVSDYSNKLDERICFDDGWHQAFPAVKEILTNIKEK